MSKTVPLSRDAHDVWSATTGALSPGTYYALRADGPDRARCTRSTRTATCSTRTRAGSPARPTASGAATCRTAGSTGAACRSRASRSITPSIYEAHVRGLTQLNPDIPEELRGTYAGLAHPSTIAYLKNLGVTTVELLPVHQHVDEQRLQEMGLVNYWGYNTLNFFTPHAEYASRAAQFGGTGAVLREFKGMVRLLHEAGLEVDARRGLQPHLGGDRGRPDQQLPRARRRELLPAPRRTATTSTSPDAATPSTSRRPRPSGSSSTRCGTGRTTCRSTDSGST